MKTGIMSIPDFRAVGFRLDPSFHLSEGVEARRVIGKSPYHLSTIGTVSSRIFYGNRAKRVYVKSQEYGIPFLSSSDILQADLSFVNLASKKYTSVEDMALEEGWILVSRSGTVGNTAWTNKLFAQKLASEHVIRIVPNDIIKGGMVYAYLATRYGHAMLTQGEFGGVIQHIEPDYISSIQIPEFPDAFQKKIDEKIKKAARLREEANDALKKARKNMLDWTGLGELSVDEYDYFGPSVKGRKNSIYTINRRQFFTTTINAFNLSIRNRTLQDRIRKTVKTKNLKECLDERGFFSSSSFPAVKMPEGKGIEFINQRDIFDTIIKGDWISRGKAKLDRLVEKGEVIIASAGTLGESESFCRCLYANEILAGKLISSHFIRMKTNASVSSGYLYLWLSSEYGFRLIRYTQCGMKQCTQNKELLAQIPVPILSKDKTDNIETIVQDAQSKIYEAWKLETTAISEVEAEIESWSKKKTH